MSTTWQWLEPRIVAAPEQLRERMRHAVEQAHSTSIHEQLAAAAAISLRAALQRPAHRAAALDLLSADALLTHACAAAAEAGPDALGHFTAARDASHFEQLVETES
jgi:hypothetical protein